ncbi:hypothetical protein [Brevundimonas diminuta]|uniref:hypothetical protein n=1 Tax=Brevundimonas diminuta TaxID=293 RepID=UPI0025A61AFA|nr:hypothetical protein [Brevundimonas diminuta]MDM8352864.1 hypothetical protein [Brevundimonas diminuta]
MSNTELWDKLGKTDPNQTKGFKRSGGFSGTALKPMWVWKRLTEEFGSFGSGWGCGEPRFTVVPAGDAGTLVYCTVSAWHGSPENVLWGVGGDKVIAVNKYGPQADDEAFKKAFTDALMNAFKFIGVGADIHMGLFDDSKYVASLKQEFAANEPKNPSVSVHLEGPDWWGASGPGMSSSQAKKEGWGDRFDEWLGHIPTIPTAVAWKEWCAENADDIKGLPQGWRIQLRDEAEARGVELGAISQDTRKAA